MLSFRERLEEKTARRFGWSPGVTPRELFDRYSDSELESLSLERYRADWSAQFPNSTRPPSPQEREALKEAQSKERVAYNRRKKEALLRLKERQRDKLNEEIDRLRQEISA